VGRRRLNLIFADGKSSCIYPCLYQAWEGSSADARGFFGERKCPADFGGANFIAPWTTRDNSPIKTRGLWKKISNVFG
jgi:hypothetical protein